MQQKPIPISEQARASRPAVGRPQQGKAHRWSESDRTKILAEHPELQNDNRGFIRELLRRNVPKD